MTVKRGRPRLPAGERKVLVTVMADPWHRDEIEALAELADKTLGDVHREALDIGLTALRKRQQKAVDKK